MGFMKLAIILSLLCCASTIEAQSPSAKVKEIELGGYMGGRIEQCISRRVMAQDADYLVEPFYHHEETHQWQSEFWGKWVQGAIGAYRYRPDQALKAKIEASVRRMIASQTPDGYIGNYAPESQLKQWDIWGRKYTALGLLAWYDLTGDREALKATCRLMDHLMTQVGPEKVNLVATGNYRGMASSSILEPVMKLYGYTGEEKYLKFAQYIVEQWETEGGPELISRAGMPVSQRWPHPANWFSPENGMKAYEMMSCYVGLLELYKVTGREEYLQAVRLAADHIVTEEINLTGSGSAFECWYGGEALQTRPTAHTMETCVTFTWMQLCSRLLEVTGESRYADYIESSAYNALLAAMKDDASEIAKYSPLVGHRFAGEEQCGMTINCCNANGPRGFVLLPAVAYTGGEGRIDVNLYIPSQATVALDAKRSVTLRQETDYPADGAVRLTLNLPKPTAFTLALRIPEWSRVNEVQVNGEAQGGVRAGAYCLINRTWRKDDVVTLTLDMRAHLLEKEGCQAIVRGPIVLARDSRFHDGYVDEAVDISAGAEGVKLQAVPSTGFSWLTFTLSTLTGTNREGVAPQTIHLCDFASAGNSWDEQERYRVWLPRVLDVRRPTGSDAEEAYRFADGQLRVAMECAAKAKTEEANLLRRKVTPRTIDAQGRLVMVGPYDWCSGFFAGTLWQMYARTRDPYWRQAAAAYTWPLEEVKNFGGTHDLGFMLFCSFGKAWQLTGEESYRDVWLEGARALASRFNETVGCIRSWDHLTDRFQYPVIIDNLMNLEMLFEATRLTGDSLYWKVAVRHADTTLRNHFREDFSSYHVVDYDLATGEVKQRCTFQGYADDSYWSRGQSWGLYGYTVCYRYTRDEAYLRQAQGIADFVLGLPNLPADGVPYWDMKVPAVVGATPDSVVADVPRDASAAAVMASGLYELADYSLPTQARRYREAADRILHSLHRHYQAVSGSNYGFLLLHSTGYQPAGIEVDVPLNYADYYYLEALQRSGR